MKAIAVFAAAALLPSGLRADEGDPPQWATLLEDVDAVIDGSVEDMRPAPGGLWRGLRVHAVLSGVCNAPRLHLYTHGPGTSESARLLSGRRYVVGLRWLLPGGGAFHAKLLARFDRAPEPAGLAAADGVIEVRDERHAARLAEAVAQLRILRRASAGGRVSAAELAPLSHPEAGVREAALRLLAQAPGAIAAEARPLVEEGFSAEVRGGEGAVQRAYLDLLRAERRGAWRCDGSLCELVLQTGSVEVALEATDALSRLGSDAALSELASRYTEASVSQRGRILKVLARRRPALALALCREALDSGDERLGAAALEALPEVPDAAAVRLLEETRDADSALLRRLSIEGLRRPPASPLGDE